MHKGGCNGSCGYGALGQSVERKKETNLIQNIIEDNFYVKTSVDLYLSFSKLYDRGGYVSIENTVHS